MGYRYAARVPFVILFRACRGFPLCKRAVTVLDSQEYLLLDYFLYLYRFACGGGILFEGLHISPIPLCNEYICSY